MDEKGQIIIFAVVFMAILLGFSASLAGYTILHIKAGRQDYAQNQALYLAEAGIEKAIYELNQNSGYTGETNTVLGNGVFTVSVSSIDSNNKIITATSYIPDSASPRAAKILKINASIDTTQVSFNFGVQVGAGGLATGNTSRVIGNVFSNGSISGGGTITGDATIAAGASATADQEWAAQNGDFSFADISSRRDAAQGFKPAPGGDLRYASFYIKKVGSPGDLTLKLVTDNSGKPSKTVLASGAISASLITSSYGWIDGYFSGGSNLSPGQQYWIILSPASVNGSNYFILAKDSSDSYNRGTAKYSDDWDTGNPSWTAANADFNFKTYMGGAVNSLSGSMDINGTIRAEEIAGCGAVGGDAYYAAIDSCTVNGVQYPGAAPEAPQAMPISDAQITAWKTDAEAGGVIAGPHTVNGAQSLGPIKINGDLIISGGATLNLAGTVWVKGNITFNQNSFLQVDSSLGNSGAALVADNPDNLAGSGLVDVENGMTVIGNGNPNGFAMIITTNTSSNALHLKNNSSGAVYYASAGTVQVSNNAGASQITGYGISLANGATVTYDTGLADANFSSGPGGSWAFLPNSYVVVK